MSFTLNRRTALRGMVNGMAVAVGLPLLDAFLDGNGAAMAATGAPMPVRFGTWFWGLGVNPPRWYPSKIGADYDLKEELAAIAPLKHKVNILGDFSLPLDGRPNLPHISGGIGIRTGMAIASDRGCLRPPSTWRSATLSAPAPASVRSNCRRRATRAIRCRGAAMAI